jgi:hypothetical protein
MTSVLEYVSSEYADMRVRSCALMRERATADGMCGEASDRLVRARTCEMTSGAVMVDHSEN